MGLGGEYDYQEQTRGGCFGSCCDGYWGGFERDRRVEGYTRLRVISGSSFGSWLSGIP
jgi:hypothetical protein